MFPSAGQSFLAGLRGALSDAGCAHDVIPEPVGPSADKALLNDRIQRLLLQQQPDVVTGIAGAGVLRHVHTLFLDAATPFLLNDMGADPLMTGGVRNPYLFSNSFNLWQSMYALGFWASQHVGKRACVATGFHDAGYGFINAFWLGFCEAGGGTVLATEVTHRETADDDPTEAVRRLPSHEPDFVMAFYAGREGAWFAKAWSALGLAGRIPLLTTPLMAHDYWREQMPADAVAGMRTAFSWDERAHLDALDRFRTAAKIETGQQPAVFALLGYETGLFLAAAAERLGDTPRSGRAWRDALSNVSIQSPRGEVRFDTGSGEVTTVDYLQEWQRASDGAMAKVTLGTLPLPPSFQSDYESINRNDVRSGWFNPYLVT